MRYMQIIIIYFHYFSVFLISQLKTEKKLKGSELLDVSYG